MKRIILFLFTGMSLVQGYDAAAQAPLVVNLSTGINNTTGLFQPLVSNDDTWTVKTPTGSSFVNALVSNGTVSLLPSGNKYPDVWDDEYCAQWISPHTYVPATSLYATVPAEHCIIGKYTYRTTFTSNSQCPVSSALMHFDYAGADNYIDSIVVNGHPYYVGSAVDFTPLTPNLNITIAPAHIVNGVNIIKVIVNNTGAWHGLYLCGNLTVNYSYTQPVITGNNSFCPGDSFIFSGASSTGPITHYNWNIIKCDAFGNPVGTAWSQWYSGAPGSINFSLETMPFRWECGKYYRITLTVNTPCEEEYVTAQKLVYIKCPPRLNPMQNRTVCPGAQVTLNAAGDATSYIWSPGGYTTGSITVFPSTTTTYTVTGTTNGCSSSASVTVTVAPGTLNQNISTGISDLFGTQFAFGASDDTWRLRGTPGALSAAGYNSLPLGVVVSPYSGGLPNWASSASVRWVSNTASVTGAPVAVLASQGDMTPAEDNDYYFEYRFSLPLIYSNMRIETTQYASDNSSFIYLNSGVLLGSATNLEYSLPTLGATTNFTTLHNPGNIATNPAHYNVGENVLLVRIVNGGGLPGNTSYLGFLMNARIRGECLLDRQMVTENESEKTAEIESSTLVYPNPSTGMFTVSSGAQIISSITIRDAVGRKVKTMNEVNNNQLQLDLQTENKGIYIIQLNLENVSKPVFKKVILN